MVIYTKEFQELLKMSKRLSEEARRAEAVMKAKRIALSAIHVRIGELADSGEHLQVKA